jgi:hypothetical protein
MDINQFVSAVILAALGAIIVFCWLHSNIFAPLEE